MLMIFIKEKPLKKPKRKPGWQQKEAEYQAWLKQVNSVSLFGNKTSPFKQSAIKQPVKPISLVQPQGPVDRPSPRPASLMTFGGIGGKPLQTPEALYPNNPELQERERKARERKFNTAPAYNKGPSIYVSEDEITNVLVGGRRRS